MLRAVEGSIFEYRVPPGKTQESRSLRKPVELETTVEFDIVSKTRWRYSGYQNGKVEDEMEKQGGLHCILNSFLVHLLAPSNPKQIGF